MNKLTVGSLFDGSGTAPLAATILGWDPLWASEIEPFPIAVTKARFPEMKHLGDISKINGAEIDPVDIIVGGSPCTDLSIAGKQLGLQDGKQSHLFYEMTRIVREMREATHGTYPRFVVWENVPGAFSSNKGEDFRAVVEEFCRITDDSVHIARPTKWRNAGEVVGDGWSFAWRVIDAKHWGVPQRRRRIYAVLDLGSERAGEILFERTGLPWDTQSCGAEGQGITTDAVGRTHRGTGVRCLNPHDTQSQRVYDARGIYPAVTANVSGGQNRQAVVYPVGAVGSLCARHDSSPCEDRGQPFIAYESGQGYWMPGFGCLRAEGENRPSRPSHCVVYDARGNRSGDVAAAITGDHENRITDYTNVVCMESAQANAAITEGISPCLNASHEQPILFTQSPPPRRYIVRRLTPTECARLQGFPDWWTDGISVQNPTEQDIEFWTDVWETYRKVMNPKGKPKTRKQIIKWLGDPGSDSNKYKMWGNGMALPCMLAVLNGINPNMSQSHFAGLSSSHIGKYTQNKPNNKNIMAVDCYNQSVSDVAMTLSSSASDYDHVPCVVYETNHKNV